MACGFLRCYSGNKCYMYMYVFMLRPISFINLTCSAIIAFRIWSVDRAYGKYRETKSTLKPVLAVVIESGAIYSAFLTILLVIYLSHSWAHYILSQAVSSFAMAPTDHSSSRTWIDNPNHCEIVARPYLFDRFVNLMCRALYSAWSLYGWGSRWLGKMVARTVLPWRLSLGNWQREDSMYNPWFLLFGDLHFVNFYDITLPKVINESMMLNKANTGCQAGDIVVAAFPVQVQLTFAFQLSIFQ